ncbi:MAG: hypothetical protein EBR30_07415 [Cytophagia bacterium]|nr:hypothetical protein [Cytophagia bacterium]
MKIDDIIAAASEELNCGYEANALWFEVLINQAIKSHKTIKKFIEKTENVEVSDRKITLPSGWFKIKGVYLCGTSEKYCEDIDYTIQGETLIFDSAIPLADGTKISIIYLGLRTDEDDNIVIPDDWERMLVAYVGWKYTRRYIKDFGVAVMQNYQREYQTQKLGNT